MEALNKRIHHFLAKLESKFDCQIEFVSLSRASYLIKEDMFCDKDLLGFPFFVEDTLCGYFLISSTSSGIGSSQSLNKKTFQLLKMMIEEGLKDFSSFYKNSPILSQFKPLDSNIIPFTKNHREETT